MILVVRSSSGTRMDGLLMMNTMLSRRYSEDGIREINEEVVPMSNEIWETEKMVVTAFVGKEGDASIQFTMKMESGYAQLNEAEVLELVYALLSRVLRKEGYRATD